MIVMEDIYVSDYRTYFPNVEKGVHLHLSNMDYPTLHTHNYWEFFIITEGKCIHEINGERVELGKYDCCLIHPEDRHAFFSHDAEKNHELNIMFTEEMLRSLTSEISSELFGLIYERKIPHHIVLNQNTFYNFMDTLHVLQTLPVDAVEQHTSIIRFMILDAIKLIYMNRLSKNDDYPAWLNDFLHKIKQPENIGLRVDDIYTLSNFSQVHLSRLFKEYVGETLVACFAKIKLSYAAMLLQTTNFTVLEISSRIGYSSLSHFIKTFKEQYNLTPNAYRDKQQKKSKLPK